MGRNTNRNFKMAALVVANFSVEVEDAKVTMDAKDISDRVDQMVTVLMHDDQENLFMPNLVDSVVVALTEQLDAFDALKSAGEEIAHALDAEQQMDELTQKENLIDRDTTQVELEVQTSIAERAKVSEMMTLCRNSIDECKKEVLSCIAQQQKVKRSLHTNDLFNSVSQIRWQTVNAVSPECSVRGTVVNQSGVKPFNLDPTHHTNFFISNYIWDLIETNW